MSPGFRGPHSRSFYNLGGPAGSVSSLLAAGGHGVAVYCGVPNPYIARVWAAQAQGARHEAVYQYRKCR